MTRDEVKIGAVFVDNDKRMRGRTLRVLEVREACAVMQAHPSGVTVKVKLASLHSEKRATGYSLAEAPR